MALTKLMGQNFRAFVGGTAAANAVVEETNCSVQIQGNMEDASTKDTENAWTTESMSSKTKVRLYLHPLFFLSVTSKLGLTGASFLSASSVS